MVAKTPKWETELERLRQDPTLWASLKQNIRKTLIERGYVDEQGHFIEQIPDAWYVEVWVKSGDEEKWIKQISPLGENLVFDNPDDAEKSARQLSLLNNRIYRVCQFAIAPAFAVFEFGQRFTEDGLTHVRTRMETALFEDRPDDQDTTLYHHQSRMAGRSVAWGPSEAVVYLDLPTAAEAARSISKANPRREYRIVVGETGLSPRPVIYRNGEPVADVEVLSQMCDVTALKTSEALVSILITWKGADSARTLVEAMYQEFPRS